jgi:DNA repair protein RecN (Recombination protein N)
MLKHLQISNYALINKLELDFQKGLIILTGETGSGKSILLGALGLIMGDRADSKVVFNPDVKCIVEATFDVTNYTLHDLFESLDLDYEPELVIRREIAPGGKSRAFVNDSPVSLNTLQQLSAYLVDLHQQFDTLDLVDASFQMNVLDAISGNMSDRDKYMILFKKYAKSKVDLERLIEEEKRAISEKEFIQFQLTELNEAGFYEQEQVELERELQLLSHAEDIRKYCQEAMQILNQSDYSILQQFPIVASAVDRISEMYPENESMSERLESVRVELWEINRELEAIDEKIELDPERLNIVQDRLNMMYRFFKKHQVDNMIGLIQVKEQLSEKTNEFDSLEEKKSQLENTCQQYSKELEAMAEIIHDRRKKAVPDLEKSVQELLSSMNMEHARLQIEIKSSSALNRYGKDEVRFLCATNRGSAFLPIKDIASGGELSRIALSIKSLVGKAMSLPTMIFDEIDTGVSGQVALNMGHLLKKLALGQQVMVITHTPQVAARADQHLVVYKLEEATSTVTRVKELDQKERINALAIMLSTNPPSSSAIANAQELISLS